LPGFTQRLERVKFGRLDGYELPAILASDGCRLALYTSGANDCLFETTLDPDAISYSICFADVDHDLLSDILIGYYYNAGVFQSDTVCKLELYRGGADYNAAESFFYLAEGLSEDSRPSPWSFVELAVLDVNDDNLPELFFSYDRYETMKLGETILQFTSGQTRAYSTFPDALNWERSALLSHTEPINLTSGPNLYAANRYESMTLLPSEVTAKGWVEIMSGGGDLVCSIGQDPQPVCSGDSTQLIFLFECLAVGNMNLLYEGPEILVRSYFSQVCYTAGEISDEYTDSAIRLYSLGSLPDVDLVWTDLSPSVTSNFRYLPQSPGFFFSANSSRVGQHNGLSGEISYLSEELGADTLIWTDNPHIAGGELMGIRNQTLSIYHVDTYTDMEGNPSPGDLPSDFSLGHPYPNPFNSSSRVDYYLPTRTHVNLGVYNALGQNVKNLVDGAMPAGKHFAHWDGTDRSGKPVASGVYLFEMRAGDFVDSKKVVLLK